MKSYTPMTFKELHKLIPDWLLITATVFVAVFFLLVATYFIFQHSYEGRVYPGIRVVGTDVGGLDYAKARSVIEKKITAVSNGIPVRYHEHEVHVSPDITAFNPDLSAPAVEFSADTNFQQLANIGHDKSDLQNMYEQAAAMLGAYNFPLAVTIHEPQLSSQLTQGFADLEQPPVDAKLSVKADGSFVITDAKAGRTFNYDVALTELAKRYQNGSTEPVILTDRLAQPVIQRSDIEDVRPQIEKLLTLAPVTLVYENKKWKLDKSVTAAWISVQRQSQAVVVAFDKTAVHKYVQEKVAPVINTTPLEAKLSIENGRVSVWQAGRNGVSLDIEAAVTAISAWSETASDSENTSSNIALTVTSNANMITDQSAADLGLQEIIGTGTSTFARSPSNRRHNIRTGAMALNGLLIKPGEEFSLLKALGNIDARNGYLPELVIKGNKTTPEFGGGLCQIGTTAFRATFHSGLPVTQRRNHSYRVVYYEPAGTDATIYDPAPDYRFMNDTGHYILIQARLNGDSLSFDFWGTKDGRQVIATKPVIYNIVKPAPTKIIATRDLPEGRKKCTESAHAGADAYFDYSVTYPNGQVKQQRFSSHYIPWQAVCLVGAKKAEPTAPTGPSTPGTPSGTIAPAVTPTATATN